MLTILFYNSLVMLAKNSIGGVFKGGLIIENRQHASITPILLVAKLQHAQKTCRNWLCFEQNRSTPSSQT
jgi:hypothetical protein